MVKRIDDGSDVVTERRRSRCRQLPRQSDYPTTEQRVARTLRLDHAGEYRATCIYEDQLTVPDASCETTAGIANPHCSLQFEVPEVLVTGNNRVQSKD